jgi:hypothetical protein
MAEILKQIKTQILLRSDSHAAWGAADPYLGKGEIAVSVDTITIEGVEKTVTKFKIGDGVSTWSQLPYFATDSVEGLENRIGIAEGKITTAEGKITTAEGKITTLEGLVADLSGAQVNVIESVKVKVRSEEGVQEEALAISDKTVVVDLTAYATSAELTAVDNKFANYTTTTALNTLLADYATTTNVKDLEARINKKLVDYITDAQLSQYQETVATALELKANAAEVENKFKDYETAATAAGKYVAKTDYNAKVEELTGDIEDITKEGGAIDTAVAAAKEALQANINKKVDITTYEEKVNSLEDQISTLTSGGLVREVVPALPEKAQAKENIIYLVPATESKDIYDEYLYIAGAEGAEGHFELIGNTAVSFDGYATEDYVDGAIEEVQGSVDAIYAKDAEGKETGVLVEKLTAAEQAHDADIKGIQDQLDELTTGENSVAKQIETAVKAEKDRAELAEQGLDGRIDAIEALGLEANYAKKSEVKEVSDAVENITKAEEGVIDTRIAVAKTELEGKINAKADASALADYVTTTVYEQHTSAYAKHLEDYAQHLTDQKDVDDAQDERLEAVENSLKTLTEGEGSVAKQIEAAVAAEAKEREDADKELDDRVKVIEGYNIPGTYASKSELSTAVQALEGADTTLSNGVKANKDAIDVLNGNADTVGSVANTVKQAVNTAKYITSVDEEVFVVNEGVLSLNPNTVFVLDGGNAAGFTIKTNESTEV